MFGGIQKKEPIVGLLSVQFQESKLDIEPFGSGSYVQPAYQVTGDLVWFLSKSLANPDQEQMLKKLVAKLMQFSMILGGFGKSWRRVDHRKFFEEYYEDTYKALIGCHWEWAGDNTKRRNVQVAQPKKLGAFIERVREAAKEWILAQNKPLREGNWATAWREAWNPSNVQVWGRVADNYDESSAVQWFHKSYQSKIEGVQPEGSIYKSHLTGKIGQISRIWHRMYPVVLLKKDPENPKKPIVKSSPRYLEILTIFPDNSHQCNDFLEFLNTNPDGFEQLWGDK